MSDFQDFLRHEAVHVVRGEFKPGTFAQAQDLYSQAISTYSDGFEAAYLLREPNSDRGLSIIFWKSLEQMDEQQRNETHQAILAKMAALFTQQPESSVYELASHLVPDGKEVAVAGVR